jgi:hypothetical protein
VFQKVGKDPYFETKITELFKKANVTPRSPPEFAQILLKKQKMLPQGNFK